MCLFKAFSSLTKTCTYTLLHTHQCRVNWCCWCCGQVSPRLLTPQSLYYRGNKCILFCRGSNNMLYTFIEIQINVNAMILFVCLAPQLSCCSPKVNPEHRYYLEGCTSRPPCDRNQTVFGTIDRDWCTARKHTPCQICSLSNWKFVNWRKWESQRLLSVYL